MGINTNNRILNQDTTINTSNNNIKSKTDEKAREAFQDIMGMMSTADSSNSACDQNKTVKNTFTKTEKVSYSPVATDKNDTTYKTEKSKDKLENGKLQDDTPKYDIAEKKNDIQKEDTSSKSDAVSNDETVSKSETISNDETVSSPDACNVISEVGEETEIHMATDVAAIIISNISEILNVSVEEIEAAIQKLDMNMSDLLDENSVKNLVLKLESATEIDLLINEELGQNIKDILENIRGLLESVDIDNTIKTLDVDLTGDSEIITDTVSDENVETEVQPETFERPSDGAQKESGVPEIKSEYHSTASQTGQNQSQSGDDRGGQQMTSADARTIDGIAQALANAVNNSGQIGEFEGDVQAADIVRQVVEQIKTNINDKIRSLEIRLNPENLGRVQISVTTKNGVMQAQIIAETEAAKNAIEGSLALLKETFNENELKVEAVEVMVATYDFFKEEQDAGNDQSEQKKSSHGGNSENINDDIVDEELSEAQQLEKDMMQQAGNSVSYSI